MPEINTLLKLVPMDFAFRWRLTATIVIDYAGAFAVELFFKHLFGDTRARGIVIDGIERREKRRALEAKQANDEAKKER